MGSARDSRGIASGRARPVAAITASASAFFLLAPVVMGGVIPWALTRWRVGPDVTGRHVFSLIGWCGVGIGAVIVIEAFVRFVRRGRGTPAPYDPTLYLVESGSYRYVRNPMYVGLLMLVVGQALILRRSALVWYALALGLAFHLRVVLHEEPYLERRFGESYRNYCRHVRRWMPRVRPYTEEPSVPEVPRVP